MLHNIQEKEETERNAAPANKFYIISVIILVLPVLTFSTFTCLWNVVGSNELIEQI